MNKRYTALSGCFFLIGALAGLITCGGGGDSPGILFPAAPPPATKTVTLSGSLDYKENSTDKTGVALVAASTPAYSPVAELGRATPSGGNYAMQATLPAAGDVTVYFFVKSGEAYIPLSTARTVPEADTAVSGLALAHNRDVSTVSGTVSVTVASSPVNMDGQTLYATETGTYSPAGVVGSAVIENGAYSMTVTAGIAGLYFHAPVSGALVRVGDTSINTAANTSATSDIAYTATSFTTVSGSVSYTVNGQAASAEGLTLEIRDNAVYGSGTPLGSGTVNSGAYFLSITTPGNDVTGYFFLGAGHAPAGSVLINAGVPTLSHAVSCVRIGVTTPLSGSVSYTRNGVTSSPDGLSLEVRDSAVYGSGTPLGSGTVSGGAYSITIPAAAARTVYFFIGPDHAAAGSVYVPALTESAVIRDITYARIITTVISGTVSYTVNSTPASAEGLTLEIRDNAVYASGAQLGTGTVSGNAYSVSFTAPTAAGTTAYFFIGPDHASLGSQIIAAFEEGITKDLSWARTIDTVISGTVSYTVNSTPASAEGLTLEIRDNAVYASGAQLGSDTVSGGAYTITMAAPVTAAKTVYFFLGPEQLSAGSVSVPALATAVPYNAVATKTTGGGSTTTITGTIDMTGQPSNLAMFGITTLTVRDGSNNLLGAVQITGGNLVIYSYTVDIPTPPVNQTVYFRVMGGNATLSSTTINAGQTAVTYDLTGPFNTTTVTGTVNYKVNGTPGDITHDTMSLLLSTSASELTGSVPSETAGILNYDSSNFSGKAFRPDAGVTVHVYAPYASTLIGSFTLDSAATDNFTLDWNRDAIKISGTISGDTTNFGPIVAASSSASLTMVSPLSDYMGTGGSTPTGPSLGSSYYVNINVPSTLPQRVYLYGQDNTVLTVNNYVQLGYVDIPMGTEAGAEVPCNLTIP